MMQNFHSENRHYSMRNLLLISAVLIFCSGCSTIVMHTESDPLKREQTRGIYSGVRLDSGLLGEGKHAMKTPRTMVIGYSCFDIPFSIVADTICLPVDLFYQPHEAPPKVASVTTANNDQLHASAVTSGASNH